jgi:hypothetical protein
LRRRCSRRKGKGKGKGRKKKKRRRKRRRGRRRGGRRRVLPLFFVYLCCGVLLLCCGRVLCVYTKGGPVCSVFFPLQLIQKSGWCCWDYKD